MTYLWDWCSRSWNMKLQFGTFTLIASRKNWTKVQNRAASECAARFMIGNNIFKTGSMTDILGQLKWQSLRTMQKDSRLIQLYEVLDGKSRIYTDDFVE